MRFLLRTALRLRQGVEIIGEATTSDRATSLAATLQPDIVVLDLGLPDTSGRETFTRIRAAAPKSRIVIYTGHDSEPDWYERRGAGAYITKDTDPHELVDAFGP
jgi:DNA-binding NarL/FixJ family response regulator